MRCPTCGARVKRSHDRCPACGAPLVPTMRPEFGGAARDLRGQLGMPDAPARPAPTRHRRAVWAWAGGAVALALLVAAALVVLRGVGARVSGVPIDSATFPDAALRAVVRTYDADGNGALSGEELASVTSLDCSDRDVESLEGIARLTALTRLDASGNAIRSADLSGNPALTEADLSGNGMASLTLGSLPQLASLEADGNALAALDVSGCPALASLDCRSNQIARLDLARNAQVTSLLMDDGQNVTLPLAAGFFPDAGLRASLAALDSDGDGGLSERERASVTSLTVTDASTADLTGLSWFPSLTSLDVSGTQVSRLSSDVLPATVTSLAARGCPLAEVSLWAQPLYTLDLAGSSVSSLDLSSLTRLTSLDVSGCPSLTHLDLAPCAATLATLRCDDGLVATGAVTRTSSAFPDEALRALVFGSAANADGDDLLAASELAALTSLDLSGSQVRDTTGLAMLPRLSSLTCRDVALGSFSCAGLGALTNLTLTGCSLSSLSLEGAANLVTLDVSNNQLTSLVCTPAPNLAMVGATGNPGLASIDVTGCEHLAGGQNVSKDAATQVVSQQG